MTVRVRIVTIKADSEQYLCDGAIQIGDFSGENVSESPVLELGSDAARTAIQNALAELESGKADQVEITRVLEASKVE